MLSAALMVPPSCSILLLLLIGISRHFQNTNENPLWSTTLSRLHLLPDLRQDRLQSLTISISLLLTNEAIQRARPGRRGHSRGESVVVLVELQDLVYFFQAHVGLDGDGFLPDNRPPLLGQFWRVLESHCRNGAGGVWRDLLKMSSKIERFAFRAAIVAWSICSSWSCWNGFEVAMALLVGYCYCCYCYCFHC